ncbi:MAG: hypothetical protein IT561_28505 [Alphaproteobacteria bacterium]|nr:hypothetical protein [Alphaproteobacteria bacterium]
MPHLLSLLLLALLVLCGGSAEAAPRSWLVFFEAIPATGIDLPRLTDAPYDERLVVAERVRDELLAEVVTALALGKDIGETAVAPGGWMLATEPSLQASVPGGEAPALKLAAALGYVLRQSAVLAADLGDDRGAVGYAIVALPAVPADPALAQRFFLHAAGIDRGLAGGYSTVGAGLLYFNLRDRAGRPYGGLDDAAFADALRQAATTFQEPPLRFATAGRARVVLVANDWASAPNGAAYRLQIGSGAVPALDRLQERHRAIVGEVAARFGWR